MAETKNATAATSASNSENNTVHTKYIKQETWVSVEIGTVLSFMPGTVSDIKVKKGDKVRKGDLLLVFRAMKMNNKILAPVDGTVKEINVKKGENIAKNTVMIVVG